MSVIMISSRVKPGWLFLNNDFIYSMNPVFFVIVIVSELPAPSESMMFRVVVPGLPHSSKVTGPNPEVMEMPEGTVWVGESSLGRFIGFVSVPSDLFIFDKV